MRTYIRQNGHKQGLGAEHCIKTTKDALDSPSHRIHRGKKCLPQTTNSFQISKNSIVNLAVTTQKRDTVLPVLVLQLNRSCVSASIHPEKKVDDQPLHSTVTQRSRGSFTNATRSATTRQCMLQSLKLCSILPLILSATSYRCQICKCLYDRERSTLSYNQLEHLPHPLPHKWNQQWEGGTYTNAPFQEAQTYWEASRAPLALLRQIAESS